MITEVLTYFSHIATSHVEINDFILTHKDSFDQKYNQLKGCFLAIDPLTGRFSGALDQHIDLDLTLNLTIGCQFSGGEDVNSINTGYHAALQRAMDIASDILSKIELDIHDSACPIQHIRFPAALQTMELKTQTWAAVELSIPYTLLNKVDYNPEKWQ